MVKLEINLYADDWFRFNSMLLSIYLRYWSLNQPFSNHYPFLTVIELVENQRVMDTLIAVFFLLHNAIKVPFLPLSFFSFS
jgi:hypothetical protein